MGSLLPDIILQQRKEAETYSTSVSNYLWLHEMQYQEPPEGIKVGSIYGPEPEMFMSVFEVKFVKWSSS